MCPFWKACLAALLLPGAVPAGPVESFPPDRVRLLDGPFKQIQDLHRTGMVGQLEPDRLLFPFRRNAGIAQPAGLTSGYGGWDDQFLKGHYAGHYLSAASRLFAATGDVSFRDKANLVVSGMAACQEKLGGGYLSAFPASQFDRLEAKPQASSVEYYTIHKILAGLVDTAEFCGNRQALEVASRMSDSFAARMARLRPDQIEVLLRTDYTANPTNEFGGMAEALSQLCLVAKKRGLPDAERHLKLAAVFNRDWFVEPLLRHEDKLDGLHGNTHIAQACGLARYALAAGEARTAKAAETFWDLVVNHHSFVNGSNAFEEKLRGHGIEVAGKGAAALGPLTSEACNTHNMLKLTASLFQLAPAPDYADYTENALYNHILATIAPDTGLVMYHMPMRPGDFRIHIHEPFCCQGTGIENAARFGDGIYFHQGTSLWINLFIPSTLDWREQGMRLRMETRYPEDGTVRISVGADQPSSATIRLRVPGWLERPATIRVNGTKTGVVAAPGSYAVLERTWQEGDKIEIEFPLALRVRPSRDDPSMVSFFYGPVLLAGALGRDGMPESDIGKNTDHAQDPPWPVPVFVKGADNPAPGRALRPVAGSPGEFEAVLAHPATQKDVVVRLAPFHRVHHQRYALYWKVATREEIAAGARRWTDAATR